MKGSRIAVRTMKALEKLVEDNRVLREEMATMRYLLSLPKPTETDAKFSSIESEDMLEKALEQPVEVKPKRGRPAKK